MADEKKTNEESADLTIDDKRRENSENFDHLTNKNRDYMVKLNRKLDEYELEEERKVEIYHEMLPTMIEYQRNHVTARKLYGPVTQQANYILENPSMGQTVTVERSDTWKLYLDGALLLGGMFSLISGISYVLGNEMAGLGLITLLLNFIFGGAAMLVINKYAPVPGQKGGFLKYILATTATMAVWILLMSVGALIIPAQLNPFIPGSITLVIGLVALGLKWYLKRKLNIQGTLV